jgi:hypothetical protein
VGDWVGIREELKSRSGIAIVWNFRHKNKVEKQQYSVYKKKIV